ncbi:MAG: hypothetical protein IPP63_13695 [Chloracidobacterium sp.]|nr:hypothetical protein [Chloracidobacterium sp.]
MLNKLAKQADKMLDKASPRWGGGRIGNIVSDLRKSVESFEQTTKETMDAFAMFKPFMIDNDYLYRSDNLRALHAVIREKEKNLLPWYPERIDWYDYWLNIHFPGMRNGFCQHSKKSSRQSKSVLIRTKICSIFSTPRSNVFRLAWRCESSEMDVRSNIRLKT